MVVVVLLLRGNDRYRSVRVVTAAVAAVAAQYHCVYYRSLKKKNMCIYRLLSMYCMSCISLSPENSRNTVLSRLSRAG